MRVQPTLLCPTKHLLTWGDEPERSCKRGQNVENITGKEDKRLKELPLEEGFVKVPFPGELG